MSKKSMKRREVSPEMQAARLRNQIHGYREEQEFRAEFGWMDYDSLNQAANNTAVLATRLRALAWEKRDAHTNN